MCVIQVFKYISVTYSPIYTSVLVPTFQILLVMMVINMKIIILSSNPNSANDYLWNVLDELSPSLCL